MRRGPPRPDSPAINEESRRRQETARTLLGAVAIMTALVAGEARSSPPAYELPPIRYSHAKPRDAVAQLLKRIAAGEITLMGSDHDILRAVLRELSVPEESQIVVFSKTSLQSGLIRPDNPRALYFSDSVYVGYVPGGLIEIAAVDPELGPVFYSFDPQDARDARRTFVRETTCLRCHGGTFSRDIPGLIERSVVATDRGDIVSGQGAELVDDATPFERRWGGWYVTGYGGKENHRGNAFGLERDDRIEFIPSPERPVELSNRFVPANYLTSTSDVVALLVFQHQLAMHNSLTRAAQRCRRVLDHQRAQQMSSNGPVTEEPATDDATGVFAQAARDVVDHLLFLARRRCRTALAEPTPFDAHSRTGAPRSAKGDALKDLSYAWPPVRQPLQLFDLFRVVQRTAKAAKGPDLRPSLRRLA